VAENSPATMLNLGFLTVLQENLGYLGGYLVTNQWGRPLEFRLSTLVQPNRIQQVLYGATFQGYICADLIGRTLVEKTGTTAQCLFTDRAAVLDVRLYLEVPVACIAGPNEGRGALTCHPRFADDLAQVRQLLGRLDDHFDLNEPFARIREAIAEARKLGATSRAA
jgi:hypothetical protein